MCSSFKDNPQSVETDRFRHSWDTALLRGRDPAFWDVARRTIERHKSPSSVTGLRMCGVLSKSLLEHPILIAARYALFPPHVVRAGAIAGEARGIRSSKRLRALKLPFRSAARHQRTFRPLAGTGDTDRRTGCAASRGRSRGSRLRNSIASFARIASA